MAAIAEFEREKRPETLTVSDFRFFFLRQGAVLRTWQKTPVRRAWVTVRASSLVKRSGLRRFAHALDNSLVTRCPARPHFLRSMMQISSKQLCTHLSARLLSVCHRAICSIEQPGRCRRCEQVFEAPALHFVVNLAKCYANSAAICLVHRSGHIFRLHFSHSPKLKAMVETITAAKTKFYDVS
jgi:hypothetical protein